MLQSYIRFDYGVYQMMEYCKEFIYTFNFMQVTSKIASCYFYNNINNSKKQDKNVAILSRLNN